MLSNLLSIPHLLLSALLSGPLGPLSQFNQTLPPPPESGAAGEVALGLGLAGFMLTGFVILIALAIVAVLAFAWMRKQRGREQYQRQRQNQRRSARPLQYRPR
ncbi:MAG: hypothetical protein AB7G93_19830 [Bdellovibrionales bacterium]